MADETPREYTTEEIREQFLDHVRLMTRYWDDQPNKSSKEKLDGLAFSILTALDGCTVGLPAFIVAPSPHLTDRQYHIDSGENYYPQNGMRLRGDIGGCLHEHFYEDGG